MSETVKVRTFSIACMTVELLLSKRCDILCACRLAACGLPHQAEVVSGGGKKKYILSPIKGLKCRDRSDMQQKGWF